MVMNRTALLLVLWTMFALLPAPVQGQAEEAWGSQFQEANAAYEAGEFEEALAQYETLLQETRHFSSEFNAGNAAFKLGELGTARLHYERAKIMDPSSEELQANLALVESKIVDRITGIPSLGLKDWLVSWVGPGKLRGWLIWGLIWWSLAWGLWMYRWRRARPDSKSTLAFLGGACLALGVLGLVASSASLERMKSPERLVVMEDRIDVLSTPSSTGTVLFQLHEGAAARVLSQTNGWKEIQLDNGNVGWVSEAFTVDV